MKFKEWFNEDDHDTYHHPGEAMEEAWDKALEIAAAEVIKMGLHTRTTDIVVEVISANRTDT